MILSIGWKNIWRNRTRSLVVIIAVLLGIFGGVMASGLMKGWIEERIHSSIYNEISHVQIHDPAYMKNEAIENTIKDYPHVASILDTMKGVTAWSPRIKIFATANTAHKMGGFFLRGVDPEKEKKVSEIYKHMVAGNFLGGDPKIPSVVLGRKTAETFDLVKFQITDERLKNIDKDKYPEEVVDKLKKAVMEESLDKKSFNEKLIKELGSDDYDKYGRDIIKYFTYYKLDHKISIYMPQADGGPSQPEIFKVRGIYDTNNDMWDGMNAYALQGRIDEFTGLTRDQVHEIAIISPDHETGSLVAEKLKECLPKEEYSVKSWEEISPEIATYTKFSSVMGYIFVAIILAALAFGIINTMMMAVLERIKELGMLMAIGMNKKRVFTMIMTESVLLTLIGAIAGMAFSGVILAILGKTGINFDMFSEGWEAMGYATMVYPEISLLDYLIITLLVIITGIVSAIWPARKALKLNPVDALRTE